ncbi:MAG TPA: pyruvate kinase [Clostridiales bacterium]|nr:pyruvate kinase [Clostridiales bacterium]HCJ88818.1 pyruvate kinase [Clostridiales bacterium]
MRKTKIVCTMGPNLFEKHLIAPLMKAGMNVARFNFSHGTYETHQHYYDEVCRIRDELGLPVATMLDTKGPEIRVRSFKNGRVTLQNGQLFTLTTDEVEGDEERVSITYKELPQDIAVGSSILIDDGLIGMQVERIDGADIVCRVLNGGVVSNNKGVNIPNAHLSMPFISEKDHQDILFAIKNGYDFIAASFTRCADDIMQIRHILQENNCHTINIIAKIENMEGVENIDEILRVVDGVMVARGDLGVEVPLEDVPSLQKKLIQRGIAAGKPVITATQMLDSMIKNPRPTRAEATDVANAIYDGTSAIMLSGESAVGAYPVEAVETMVRIALRAEADMDYIRRFSRDTSASTDVTNAISHATVTSAHDLNASAIITVTKSGSTARILSRYRPACVIVGCTTEKHVWRQLALSWGTVPLMIAEESNTDDLFEHAVDAAVQNGLVHDGELVVLTAGVPLGISGTTNLMKVHVVGHLLSRGQGLHGGKVVAPLCVIRNLEKDAKNFNTGDVIVCHQTTREMFSMLRKSSAIVLEDDNPEGHGAIAGMSLDIPVIIGAKNATNILKSGAVVTVDGEKGTVSAN